MAEVVIPYKPRNLQRSLHDSRGRFNVWVCHRRFGKTVLCINELLREALLCKRRAPRYAYIAPFYRQAKQTAWDYLKHYSNPIPGRTHNEAELRVDLPNGARIQLYGADNPDSLRGAYFDGVVLDEFAQMSPRLWGEVIRPMLSDRQGWAIFVGTPNGRNEFFDKYEQAAELEGWSRAMFKASETNVISISELTAARREMTEEEYDQEFECSFEAPRFGSYYGRLINEAEDEGRISDEIEYVRERPVFTAWDIGKRDATAIWFWQHIGARIHVIDYLEERGHSALHYAEAVKDKPYAYDTNWLPHDANKGEWGHDRKPIEVLRAQKLHCLLVPNIRRMDGINAAKMILPRCHFAETACADGLSALRNYHADYDDNRKVLKSESPVHDWASDGADAFRYLSVVCEEYVAPAQERRGDYHQESAESWKVA